MRTKSDRLVRIVPMLRNRRAMAFEGFAGWQRRQLHEAGAVAGEIEGLRAHRRLAWNWLPWDRIS